MSVMQARRRRISQEKIREALCLPDAFACNDERIGVTWGLGPALVTRDSGVSSRVEAQFLLRYLRESPKLKGDWYVLRAGHWACGWVEQIAFKVLEGSPELNEPSEIFERLLDWHGAAEYDPDGFFEERDKELEEQAIEDIRNAWRIRVKRGAPESWCKEVYDVMSRKGQINEEPSGDLYISSDEINAALKELGYYDDED